MGDSPLSLNPNFYEVSGPEPLPARAESLREGQVLCSVFKYLLPPTK